MKRLAVHYSGWGEDWPLGLLADDGTTLLFEYAPEALAQGLELSPLHLKLRATAHGGFPPHLLRLPGLIADSLPDGWGLLLMNRLFRQQGLRHPGPLDRLAFIGNRAMGRGDEGGRGHHRSDGDAGGDLLSTCGGVSGPPSHGATDEGGDRRLPRSTRNPGMNRPRPAPCGLTP